MTVQTVAKQEPQSRLAHLNETYGHLRGSDLLRVMIEDIFPGRISLVSSFGTESAVLLHMIAQIDKSVPVIFLNTEKLFGETLRYRDKLIGHLGLSDVRSVRPDPAETEQEDKSGLLWTRDPDACCALRKTRPLNRALLDFDAWITGRKRFQTDNRAELPALEAQDERIKINPLIDWSVQDIKAYFKTHDLPYHPLKSEGYLSIGCMPCTRRVTDGEDYRAGRWSGRDKTECGIHVGEGI